LEGGEVSKTETLKIRTKSMKNNFFNKVGVLLSITAITYLIFDSYSKRLDENEIKKNQFF